MATSIDYFALLGVGEDVNEAELETRYQELAEFLTSTDIPGHLRAWARQQAVLVDEAYAVLADPERRAAAREEQHAPVEAATRDEAASGLEEKPPPPAKRRTRAKAGRTAPSRDDEAAPPGLPGLRVNPILLGVLLGAIALAAILVGRYGLPSGGGDATGPEEQVDAPIALDSERIDELTLALQQSPNSPEILFELGETYFQANEWQQSIDWFTQLVAVEPTNAHAWTDIGTAHFNLGRAEEAKAAWETVLEIDPNDVQAHYNMGFLYSNVEPQDMASARREWQTVVDLAPDSDLAKTAQVHLDSMPEEGGAASDELPTPP